MFNIASDKFHHQISSSNRGWWVLLLTRSNDKWDFMAWFRQELTWLFYWIIRWGNTENHWSYSLHEGNYVYLNIGIFVTLCRDNIKSNRCHLLHDMSASSIFDFDVNSFYYVIIWFQWIFCFLRYNGDTFRTSI